MTPEKSFFKKMLLPVDGSDASLKAAEYALRLAACEQCDVLVLHVVDEDVADDMASFSDRSREAVLEKMKSSGREYINDIQKKADDQKLGIETVVAVGIPSRIILSAAREREIDLIVMGTVGRKGARRVLIGSVTERVIEHSHIPVLVVK